MNRTLCRQTLAMLLAGLIAWTAAAPLGAAPNHQDPDGPLAVRPDEKNKELQGRADALYRQVRKALTEFETEMAQGQVRRVKLKEVTDAFAGMLELRRVARHLSALGETAGADYQLRGEELRRALFAVIHAIKTVPGVKQQLAQALPAVSREAEKRSSVFAKVQGLLARKEYDQAEAAFYEAMDVLESRAAWYDQDSQQSFMGRYWRALPEVDAPVQQARETAGQEALTKARQQIAPDFDKLLAQLQQAAVAVKQSGKGAYAGQSLAGPAVLSAFLADWQKAHHAALACRGLDWARSLKVSQLDLNALADKQAKFSAAAPQAVADLIAADAARASAADAPALYAEYLKALAPVVSLTGDDALRTTAGKALDALAAKSPQLAAEVGAYRRATDDLLLWRRRTAAAYARAQMAKFPPLHQVFAEATGASAAVPPSPSGTAAAPAITWALTAPAPKLMQEAAPKLHDKSALAADITGVAEAKVVASRYGQRAYATLVKPEELAAQVSALEADLLLAGTAAPLTLDAAAALASARRGDLKAAGGAITGAHMEPLVARFAAIPPAAATLVPLGALPPELPSGDPLLQILMRFEIQPAWVQQEYFFVTIGTPPAAKSP